MSHTVKGWCPGALRPMESGDGYLLRLRPFMGRFDAAQVEGLLELAQRYAITSFWLSNRANLQVRGIPAQTLPDLQRDLAGLGLLDSDPLTETRRNIILSPYSQPGDLTQSLHDLLVASLPDGPELPAKFGFAIDTGDVPCLQNDPADLRFELAPQGLMLRADGQQAGELQPNPATAVERAMQVATWFAQNHSLVPDARRMRQLVADGRPSPLRQMVRPTSQSSTRPVGQLLYAPFGQVTIAALTALAGHDLRLTPWRAVMIADPATAPMRQHWLTDPDHPLLRVAACAGAPDCEQASVVTRDLARRLAPIIPAGKTLHVSGCSKGCAHPRTADLTLCGRDGRFDLVAKGRAGDQPDLTGLSPDQLTDILRGYLVPHL